MSERLTLNIAETAAMLGISRNLCYGLAKQDALPIKVIHLGRRMVVSRQAIEKLLQEDTQKGNENDYRRC